MLALSIKQPWAYLIVHGLKDIENRAWSLPKTFKTPQRIYVHAGLKQDYSAYDGDPTYRRLNDWIRRRISPGSSFDWDDTPLKLGAIIGRVTVMGCVRASGSRWFEGPWGFWLTDAEAWETPYPYKGRQGFFEVGVLPCP